MGIFSKLFGKGDAEPAQQAAPRGGGRRVLVVEPGHGCPVILLRGGFEVFDEAKAQASGAAGMLMKPFRTEQLLDAVARAGV